MRWVRDRKLQDPFQAWINPAVPLPMGVTVLPRTVNVSSDAWRLIYIGSAFLVMGGLFSVLLKPLMYQPTVSVAAFFAVTYIILFSMPLWMAYRLWRTIGASRNQKSGTLRQGVLVGPEGLLVRLMPNRCCPIPMERFITAKEWSGGGSDGGTDWLAIETRDGPIDFACEYLKVGAAVVNQAVADARPAAAAS